MMTHVLPITLTKRRFFIIIFIISIPWILSMLTTPNMQDEITLQTNIAELQAKLEHLHSKYIISQEEIQLLSHQLAIMTENNYVLPDFQFYMNNTMPNMTSIKLPSIYNFLPHFLNDPNSLRPSFVQSKGRTGVSMILGVPTVKREVQSYLLTTLKNLIDRMTPDESADTLIVVLVAEVGCKNFFSLNAIRIL